jgi:cytochrome b6-f complex iron-sulfur subunit
MESKNLSTPPSRREFLANCIMLAGVASGVGGLAFQFLQYLYPVVPPVKLVQVLAAKLSEIPDSGMKTVSLPQGTVMLRKVGTEVHALSAVCSHLGCIVKWHDDRNRFICPCHFGNYDADGKVLSGPPPRPLTKLDVVMRGDQVYVVMKEVPREFAS